MLGCTHTTCGPCCALTLSLTLEPQCPHASNSRWLEAGKQAHVRQLLRTPGAKKALESLLPNLCFSTLRESAVQMKLTRLWASRLRAGRSQWHSADWQRWPDLSLGSLTTWSLIYSQLLSFPFRQAHRAYFRINKNPQCLWRSTFPLLGKPRGIF